MPPTTIDDCKCTRFRACSSEHTIRATWYHTHNVRHNVTFWVTGATRYKSIHATRIGTTFLMFVDHHGVQQEAICQRISFEKMEHHPVFVLTWGWAEDWICAKHTHTRCPYTDTDQDNAIAWQPQNTTATTPRAAPPRPPPRPPPLRAADLNEAELPPLLPTSSLASGVINVPTNVSSLTLVLLLSLCTRAALIILIFACAFSHKPRQENKRPDEDVSNKTRRAQKIRLVFLRAKQRTNTAAAHLCSDSFH